MRNYQISDAGVDFVKTWEVYQQFPYDDGYGYMTVGYGHRIKAGEDFSSGLTEFQATALLRTDMADAISNVNKALMVDQAQNQVDALYSFEFNTGSFGSSTLCRVINEGATGDPIRAQFMRWINAAGHPSNGLVNRRTAECNVYFDSNYVRK